MRKNIICIIQARLDSTRLPKKVLSDINGQPLILRILKRVARSKLISKIYLATGDQNKNKSLIDFIKQKTKISIFCGSEDNVLERYYKIALLENKPDIIVRITADCPFIDAEIIDKVIKLLIKDKSDYASNILKRTFPDGLDVEAFTFKALSKTFEMVKDKFSKEHVTTFMHGVSKHTKKNGNFKKSNLENDFDFSFLRWTLDEQKDLVFTRCVYENLTNYANWHQIIKFLFKNPILLEKNSYVPFNESITKDTNKNSRYNNSNAFFKRSIKSIPLGSQTFSKSYIQWPKGVAPLFIDRGQGASVVDIDGNHYIDYVLGLLPITLGYCDQDVDQAVIGQVNKGSIFSMPSKLETLLSEKLINIIPSAEYVRFGKNGSDVTTAAIRLARAYTSKDIIAVSGYHGWHDWYIGTSTRDLGVPKKIKSLTKTFTFNDIHSFQKLTKRFPRKIAACIIEPAGLTHTDVSFLKKLKSICKREGIVLIFDEIISGFRINIGGAQKEFGITPDISCFGKGMANGYPLSAIVGRKKIMSLMEDIFFSTTFGGENVALAAALATIEKMEKKNTVTHTNRAGKKIVTKLNIAIKEKELTPFMQISNNYWWPQVLIKNNYKINIDLFSSLLRQELLKNGLIIGSTLNLCFSHANNDIIETTVKKFSDSLIQLKEYLFSKNPKKYLKGDLIKKTFSVR